MSKTAFPNLVICVRLEHVIANLQEELILDREFFNATKIKLSKPGEKFEILNLRAIRMSKKSKCEVDSNKEELILPRVFAAFL